MWRKGRGNFSTALSRHLLNESVRFLVPIQESSCRTLLHCIRDGLCDHLLWLMWCYVPSVGYWMVASIFGIVLFSSPSLVSLWGEQAPKLWSALWRSTLQPRTIASKEQRCADIEKEWVCTQALMLQWSLRTADSANSFTKTYEGTWTIELSHAQISDPRNCKTMFIVLNFHVWEQFAT